ncbi:MAG: hypothetical protein JWM16_5022 [Verrucomicrobiales bacterium]|nr:hypothetical protein [Verrucomicrobiales bacterium]
MKTNLEPAVPELEEPAQNPVSSACHRIPPLWPLKNFVAVNPFLGLADRHFLDAASLMQKVGHGDMLMPVAFYLEQIQSGRIRAEHFHYAMELTRETLPAAWASLLEVKSLDGLKRALSAQSQPEAPARILTFADFLDDRQKTNWAGFVVEEISKWCSAYYDEGQSSWRMPWRDQELYPAWKAAAELDANPELMGLENFRRFVASLPSDFSELLDPAIGKLGLPQESQADFLHRQLMSISGWSSYVQFLVRSKSMAGKSDNSLAQLLAIRLVYDLMLLNQFGQDTKMLQAWKHHLASSSRQNTGDSRQLFARYLAQQALEYAYQSELVLKLKNRLKNPPVAPRRKALQAAFCIDVRSEVMRRALESQSSAIETIGFAGFFGLPIEYLRFGQPQGTARCPVLLNPSVKVRETLPRSGGDAESKLLQSLQFRQKVTGTWNSFKTSAISCFSFVETAGLFFGAKLIKDSFGFSRPEAWSSRFIPQIEREVCCAEAHGYDGETGILLADQITLAAGALRNMGLTSNFAPVVLICGHGSATVNNPYGSGLDCGACGGHAGQPNAQVAAAILNKPAVREGLRRQSITIPAETFFVAGLHNTTTDEILLYEPSEITTRQAAELDKVKAWLAGASQLCRQERATLLGLASTNGAKLEQKICERSRDWAQVRPEWGLAGNAAFIAAPRERTKDVNLGGRTFLHNYNATQDPGKSILELIMVAPMVVASWINLQYYGSTVNNRLFGSGNKVLHNVVGTFGVWQGNGGDLQAGLPLQSLHDGTKWVHEPLRLSVFLESPREAIEQVIQSQEGVRELLIHEWIHLFAIEAKDQKVWRYSGPAGWKEFQAAA